VPLVRDFASALLLFHGAVAERFGLHETDLTALRFIGEAPVTAGALAEATGLTNAAVTALIDRLQAAGFVRRERDASDRRRVYIRPVPSAVREVDKQYARLKDDMATLLGKFGASQFEAVLSYLEGATQILERHTESVGNEK